MRLLILLAILLGGCYQAPEAREEDLISDSVVVNSEERDSAVLDSLLHQDLKNQLDSIGASIDSVGKGLNELEKDIDMRYTRKPDYRIM